MRVRIQVEVNAWALDLPDDPELRNGKVTKETLGDWVWKHGKDQLLSRLSLSVQEEEQDEEKQEPNCPTAEGEEKKEPSQTEREDIPNDNHNNLQEEAKKEESEAAPAAKGDKDVPDADNAKGCPDKDVPDADNAKESPDAAADPQTVPDQKSPAISAKKSQEMQHHLELIESLQTVKKDFLERIQDCDLSDILGDEEDKEQQQLSELDQDPEQSEGAVAEEKPSNNTAAFDRNPANIALRELVDSVLSWSGTDYGFLAGVEEEELKPPSPAAAATGTDTTKSDMNDVSELDHSDIEEQFKTMKIGPHYAAVNVPLYNEDDDDDDDDENDFSSDYSTDDDDDNSVDSSERRRNDPLHRTPQPITTYGPVHYKDIPGSVTLMMDQLRFEPVNPLDMLHEVDDEDNSDHQSNQHHHCGECSSASLEYNYMEVYWDRVEKYQLTPKTSNRNLFKLIYRRAGVTAAAAKDNKAKTSASSSSPKRTAEVILKMKSRAELERIAEDVKRRVVLPSKKKKDDTPDSQTSKKKKKKRRRRKRRKQVADEEAPNLTPQQRSVMLPPSLPRRMMSERNLWNNSNIPTATATTLPSTSSHSNDSPAPRRPIRRPTMEHKLAVTTFVDDDESYDSDSDDDDDTGDVHLWAVQDLLKKCLELKRPLCFKDRKRDRRPQPTVTPSAIVTTNNSNNNNQDDKATDKTATKGKPSTALLPEKWQSLIAIPIFYSSMTKLRFVFVLATTTGSRADEDNDPDTDNPQQQKKKMPEFAHKSCLEWWVPSVTTLLQDILQHKSRLEQLTSATKTVRDLQGRLTDSLRKHSDMIHGILPPMAISKLKMQPQQWKSPLQQQHFLYNQPPKPTVVPVSAGISVDDSSISGSVHSRYGLLVGGVPSLDSSSTIQTAVQTAESEFGIYRVPEATANNNNTTPTSNAATGTTAPTNKNPGRGSANKKLPERSASTQTAQQQQQQAHPSRPVPQRTNSVGNMNNNAINTNPIIRGLHRQGSIKDRAGATRPIFSRMGSKRDMMMMRASSARGSALMRMDSAKRGNLIKMDSGRFGRRGIPRLDSLRSLHGSGMSVTTSGGLSIDTFEQSWRTMYMDDESMHLEDLSGTAKISALSQDVSYLTSQSNIKYINSSLIGGIKDVQALYAGQKSNVSIVVLSIVNFHQISSKLRVGPVMDMLAKLLFTVDRLCEKYRTIKVETIGHKTVIMSGLFTGDVDEEKAGEGASGRDRKAAIDALEMAKEMVSEGQTIQIPWESNDDTTKTDSNAKSPAKDPETLQLRVGIHIGDIKYGVLGQNVPKLDCFGDDIFVALRMEQTAPDNYIRVSRVFRDLVGPAEIDWEEGTEMIDISESTSLEAFEPAIIASASPSVEESIMTHADVKATIETYTLEPPPPAITGNCGNSVTSFPSLAPWSGDFLLGSNHEPGGMLGVQLEESFVSGEFDVD